MEFDPIAIVGKSCVLPGIRKTADLWNALLENKIFVTSATDKDWGFNPESLQNLNNESIPHTIGGHVRGFEDIFDPKGFLFDEAFIKQMDPLFQWTLHCGRETLKDLQWEKTRKKTAVILGNLAYPSPELNILAKKIWIAKKFHQDLDSSLNGYNRFVAGLPAQFLSKALDLEGPSFCLDAACASSLYAIKYACDLLHNNEVDLAISGGLNAIEGSFLHLGFSALHALSPKGQLKPFSKEADGLIPSKGAAFVALRRLKDAIQLGEPIYGVIRGIGLSNDGRSQSLLAPSSSSQIEAILKAYQQCDLSPKDISYLECHATGTPLGDACELSSIKNVFQANENLYLGSLKANMGHLLAASGAAALIKILYSFESNIIPPFLSIHNPLDEILEKPFILAKTQEYWGTSKAKIAAINAFGFGGNNAHLIVEEHSTTRSYKFKNLQKKAEPIAIVGMGLKWGRFQNKEALFQALDSEQKLNYENSIDSFEIDISRLKFPPKDLDGILPQHLILIPTLEEALEDLKVQPSQNTGILVGMGTDVEACRFKLRLDLLKQNIAFDEKLLVPLTSTNTLGCMPNIAANRLNYIYNWKAPSFSLLGENSSGFHALHLAKKHLQSLELDCMVVAGVDLSCEPVHSSAMNQCFSKEKSFPSDGCAVLILKRLSDARRSHDFVYGILDEGNSESITLNSFASRFGKAHAAMNLLDISAALLHPHIEKNINIRLLNSDFFEKNSEFYFSKISSYKKNSIYKVPKSAMRTIKTHLQIPDFQYQEERFIEKAPSLPPVLALYAQDTSILFNRNQILEHANGKLSSVFGDLFKELDALHIRVRMPGNPLLLTDRVLNIEAEKAGMGCGNITTETDVNQNSWFLHNGRMLPGAAIEAGQSDLFLISYLGVDFENRGERRYRLLGCEATFYRDLPKVGEILKFKITIDRHIKNGKTRLFFFHYECWIGNELFLRVLNGQAGFFTQEELFESQGIVWKPESLDNPFKKIPVSPKIKYSQEEVLSFSQGDAFACFGEGYEKFASHRRTPSIPTAKNLLFDEVLILEAHGGPYKLGYIKVKKTITETDWFFEGHFKNDPCMPGTLMTEMAFQALSFFMAAIGQTLDCDAFRFIPAIGKTTKLTCRGQILPQSKSIEMDVYVKSLSGDGPKIISADVILTADGLKALLAENISIQLQADWIENKSPSISKTNVTCFDKVICNEEQIYQTALGRPSLAFGSRFSIFDQGKRMARLPAEPYTFISRICSIDGEYCGMKAGTQIQSEWSIPETHPLFAHPQALPFSVLLEALLQPCGWLASYIGCPLSSTKELFFRNLEGELLVHFTPKFAEIIRIHAKVTSLVQLQDTIIVEFSVSASVKEGTFVELKTRFGYFTQEALTDQKGLKLSEEENLILKDDMSQCEDIRSHYNSKYKTIFTPYFHLIDKVKIISSDTKSQTLLAEKNISPEDWFFKAHFFQDPVMPGSLGLEAMLQVLKLSFNPDEKSQFCFLKPKIPVRWKYRGQVVPKNKKIQILAKIFKEDLSHASIDASLFVDGIKIYESSGLNTGIENTSY